MTLNWTFRAFRRVARNIYSFKSNLVSKNLIRLNGGVLGENSIFLGTPIVDIFKSGSCVIGKNFEMNSGLFANPIGRNPKSYIIVESLAKLRIGDNVGISNTAIICRKQITIGNNVKIGGNTVIYDTDFHSLNYITRRTRALDFKDAVSKEVVLEDDVFIGAHCTILKGVTIGKASIIGAASVVTKSVPAGEVWAGNPAKKIGDLSRYIPSVGS